MNSVLLSNIFLVVLILVSINSELSNSLELRLESDGNTELNSCFFSLVLISISVNSVFFFSSVINSGELCVNST